MPDRPWHRCLVRLAGLGRRPSRPTKPFPFANFYLHTWVYETVRFPSGGVDYGDAWEISVDDREDHRRYMNEDQEKRDMLIEKASPPAKIEPATSAPSCTAEVATDTTARPNGIIKVEDWLNTTDYSQEPFEELPISNDVSSEVFNGDAPDSLLDNEVSPSTPLGEDDANSMDDVDFLFANLLFPDFSNIDVDVIPVVGYSFDLTEVKEFLDPRGFLKEVEAMAELIRKSRAGMLIDVPNSYAPPDHPMACRLDDHTIPLDSSAAASPADPLAALPSNSMVALTSHGYPKTPSEQVTARYLQ
ncbi:predicted protein [Postia placenta Mad-698-R]|nr:predicted protein [Postia placenta Mad-698-R]